MSIPTYINVSTDATSVRVFRNYTLSRSIPGATRSKMPTEAVLIECSYTVGLGSGTGSTQPHENNCIAV